MRLSPKEKKAIIESFDLIFHDLNFELFLFGSRTDDNKKGGDIDLLVVVQSEFKSHFIANKTKVLLKIFESIDEQKIDITVATPSELLSDTFLNSISTEKLDV